SVRHATIELQHQRVVLRPDVAADLRNLEVGWVWSSSCKEQLPPNLPIKWPTHDVEILRGRWPVKVDIHKVRQGLGIAKKVRSRNDSVARYLAFKDQIHLVN